MSDRRIFCNRMASPTQDTLIYAWSLEYARRRVGRGANKAKPFLSVRDVHAPVGGVWGMLRAASM